MSDDNAEEPLNVQRTLRYLLSELLDVKAKIAALEAVTHAQGNVISMLAVALPPSQRPAALSLLEALRMKLEADGEPAAARMLTGLHGHLIALFGDDGLATLERLTAVISVDAALMKSVPQEKAAAMRSWLDFATEGEIAQEMLGLQPPQLDALLRLNDPAKPARRGGGRKVKKKRDGD